MPLHIALTNLLGIRVPIVSAPMAGVAGGRLAAAVSDAGALGMVGVGASMPPETIEQHARIAAAGGKPFGIGLMAWALAHRPEQLDAAIAARPTLVSVSFGDYAPFVPRLHAAGILVATQVPTAHDAVLAAAAGVDIVVARGAEAGGHGLSEVATLPLLQAVLDRIESGCDSSDGGGDSDGTNGGNRSDSDGDGGTNGARAECGDAGTRSRPLVLAAGGITTARGVAAVLAAGADGVWAGTAFLACPEAENTATARARICAAAGENTVYTRVFDIAQRIAWPAPYGGRALANAFTERWHGREEELAASPDAPTLMADAKAAQDFDTAYLYAGQGVGSVTSERPAANVVMDLAGGDADHAHS